MKLALLDFLRSLFPRPVVVFRSPPCPACGSNGPNWKPEAAACADCGYGVRITMPDHNALVAMFFADEMSEDEFAGMALAAGMPVRQIMEFIDERAAEAHEREHGNDNV